VGQALPLVAVLGEVEFERGEGAEAVAVGGDVVDELAGIWL